MGRTFYASNLQTNALKSAIHMCAEALKRGTVDRDMARARTKILKLLRPFDITQCNTMEGELTFTYMMMMMMITQIHILYIGGGGLG